MSNTEIVNRFIAAWESRDVDAIMGFFAEGATYHNMPMPALVGHEPIRAFIAGFLADTRKVTFEVRHSAETASGTVLNERIDRFVMANDKALAIPVAGVFELASGKIIAWRDYFDLKAFEAQMAAA